MTNKKSREKFIDTLAKTIENLKFLNEEWTERERSAGRNPDDHISISYGRMLIKAYSGWLTAEKEALTLLNLLQVVAKTPSAAEEKSAKKRARKTQRRSKNS